MATHSSVLASRIPGMGEPGGLPSMGSHRVGHNWSDLAAAAEYIMQNAGLDWIISWNQDCQEKYQQPQICRWCPSNGREWRGTQELLDEVEIGEWKSEFSNYDRGIWSHHFMANRRGEVEAVTDFIFLGSKITAHGDCSHEIKRCLLLGRKVMTNLGSILKSRDFTLPTKIIVVQSSNCVQPFASLVDSSTPGFPVLHCSQSGQRSTQSKLWFFQ